ncbi:PREDICTED: glutaredoxin-C11 [Nelumbo nucifera]|uniref:Glutaredoxin domain-containing protein n=2 Tax=Nelumbo nucifera TaxID=4432 RepID=A0A822Z2Q8_NELNU|nr:PREDICTED: glutaredoxin-C11 [Nelumbo nucifera]DAD37981.1 TPA_asm: hypothetical protein HUJ06_008622 [Nelumbo nucifera]
MERVTTLASRNPVVIFSKSSCGLCHAAETLIRSFGASPAVCELDLEPHGKEIERALQRLGRKSVPAIFIGGVLVGGSEELLTLQLDGSLKQKLILAGAIFL